LDRNVTGVQTCALPIWFTSSNDIFFILSSSSLDIIFFLSIHLKKAQNNSIIKSWIPIMKQRENITLSRFNNYFSIYLFFQKNSLPSVAIIFFTSVSISIATNV